MGRVILEPSSPADLKGRQQGQSGHCTRKPLNHAINLSLVNASPFSLQSLKLFLGLLDTAM